MKRLARVTAGVYAFGMLIGVPGWLAYENFVRYGVGAMLRFMLVWCASLLVLSSVLFALSYCATGEFK